ncbi:motility associated factor glycosyltransferase family protein [Spirochaeta dissipatitropha]
MRDFPNEMLSKNLLALSGFNAASATFIGEASITDECYVEKAKSGLSVPYIRIGGKFRPLHSQFDPEKEGTRLAATAETGGFIIVLGFGGGYHIRELLKNPKVESVIVIDFNFTYFRTVLSEMDVTDIFLDSRVRLFINPSDSELKTFLLERYIPAIMGDIRSIPLRSRTSMLNLEFESVMNTIQQTIEAVSDDYAVQTRFGRRWMTNTMANLAIAGDATGTLSPQKNCMIIAAGPSLDMYREEIRAAAEKSYCIATDTAVPWLVAHNIRPDIILSIDCQLVTYHHFFQAIFADIPVMFDLASPPTLTRQVRNPLFFSSGHPFSQYVNSHFKYFPSIDTSGGNVTHAAVSLAASIGAYKITIYGADYGYPDGKTYAKGTYLYNYFQSHENRLNNAESLLSKFIFDSHKIEKRKCEKGIFYSTPTLRSYQQRLYGLIESIPAEVCAVSPYSALTGNTERVSSIHELPLLRWHKGKHNSWRNFLEAYSAALLRLNVPKRNITQFFTEQDQEDLYVWMTIFPSVSYFRNVGMADVENLLKHSIDWTLKEIRKTLQAHP